MFFNKLASYIVEAFYTMICLKFIYAVFKSVIISSGFKGLVADDKPDKNEKRGFREIFRDVFDSVADVVNTIIPFVKNTTEEELKAKRKALFVNIVKGTFACIPIVLFNNIFFNSKGGIFKDIAGAFGKLTKVAIGVGSIFVVNSLYENHSLKEMTSNVSEKIKKIGCVSGITDHVNSFISKR